MGAEEGPEEGLTNHILACSDEGNDTLKENDFTACKETIMSYITLNNNIHRGPLGISWK